MCVIGHWIGESLIVRWAELTHEIANYTVPVKDVIDRLLVRRSGYRVRAQDLLERGGFTLFIDRGFPGKRLRG